MSREKLLTDLRANKAHWERRIPALEAFDDNDMPADARVLFTRLHAEEIKFDTQRIKDLEKVIAKLEEIRGI